MKKEAPRRPSSWGICFLRVRFLRQAVVGARDEPYFETLTSVFTVVRTG